MIFKLVWTIAVMAAQGSVFRDVPEPYEFKSQNECNVFAEKMRKRTEDWARGAFNAPWEKPILVLHRCVPSGTDI